MYITNSIETIVNNKNVYVSQPGWGFELPWIKLSVNNKRVDKEQCHYFGHLENEPQACVAMTGCVGSEDIEFTILSAHSQRANMFKWSKEGSVEILNRFEVTMFFLLIS